MQNEADNEVEETPEDSPAETTEQELQIPKHRFDAVNEELRRVRDENRQTNEALRQLQSQLMPRQPEETDEEEEAELESLGLDRKTTKTLKKMFNKALDKKAKTYEQQTRQMIGGLANQVEEKGFVAEYGKAAGKYLPKIHEMRRQHASQGSFLSFEMAYKLIIADEALAKPAKPQKSVQVDTPAENKVQKAETQKPQVKASAAGKSIEDWENELDESIKKGPGRI